MMLKKGIYTQKTTKTPKMRKVISDIRAEAAKMAKKSDEEQWQAAKDIHKLRLMRNL